MDTIFNKTNEIKDIQSIIDECLRESEVIEYKTAHNKFDEDERKEIVKDISAMANSMGGIIIYGIATDEKDKTKPKMIEAINIVNIETIDRVINAKIRPPIKDIKKKLIPKEKPEVMIIDIPESEDKPHQNLYDKVYYRRSGTESISMEHDLVAMHFGKRNGPILMPIFTTIKPPEFPTPTTIMSEESIIRISVENSGRKIAQHMRMLLSFPSKDMAIVNSKYGNLNDLDRLYEGQELQVKQFDSSGIIYPDSITNILDVGLKISSDYFENKKDEPIIKWIIHTEDSPVRKGEVLMKDLNWKV